MKLFCALLLGLSLLGVGCKTSTEPPVQKAAQVLVWIDAFDAGVQAACGVVQPAVVGTNACRSVQAGKDWTAIEIEMVNAAKTARVVLQKADVGWQAAVKAGWEQVRPRFDTVDLPQKVWLALIVVDAVIASIQV